MDQHVLVTGAAGFVGSHLCDFLLAQGARVTALDNLTTGRLENIAHLTESPRFHWVLGDVEDRPLLRKLAQEADLVIHLAAAVGVDLILSRPVESLKTNLATTAAVLETAHALHRRVFIASSSEVYGRSEALPYQEDADIHLGPATTLRWGYACSKAMDELLATAYARQYHLKVAVLRFFNVSGPRQSSLYGMVLPRFVRQALLGESLTVYGDGRQTRSFCHVADVVRAIYLLSQRDDVFGEIVNIGSEEEISISALAHKVKQTTGSTSAIEYTPYPRDHGGDYEDFPRRRPDLRKISGLVNWKPERNLATLIHDMAAFEGDRSG